MNETLHASTAAVLMLTSLEAMVLTTYNDNPRNPKEGVLTIGVGHTAAAGHPKPVPGLRITVEEGIAILRRDAIIYEDVVKRLVTVPLQQHQFDALWLFALNTGGYYRDKTGKSVPASLWAMVNTGKISAAMDSLETWTKDNGKVLSGLVKRRKAERTLFETGHYEIPAQMPVYDVYPKQVRYVASDSLLRDDNITRPVESEEINTTQIINPKSAILPVMRPSQDDAVTRAMVETNRHLLPNRTRSDEVVVLVLRGFFASGFRTPDNERGVYDDAAFVVLPDRVVAFNCNTESSAVKTGNAVLVAPQGIEYTPGPHGLSRPGGPYPAFRQASNVTVLRDNRGRDTDTPNKRFWCNMHRGGVSGTSSLGCITIPPHQWDEYRELLYGALKARNWTVLGVILVDYRSAVIEQTPAPVPVYAQNSDTPTFAPQLQLRTPAQEQLGASTADVADELAIQMANSTMMGGLGSAAVDATDVVVPPAAITPMTTQKATEMVAELKVNNLPIPGTLIAAAAGVDRGELLKSMRAGYADVIGGIPWYKSAQIRLALTIVTTPGIGWALNKLGLDELAVLMSPQEMAQVVIPLAIALVLAIGAAIWIVVDRIKSKVNRPIVSAARLKEQNDPALSGPMTTSPVVATPAPTPPVQ